MRVGVGIKDPKVVRRERKNKLYIEMLENKVFELQEELARMKQRLEHDEGRVEERGEAERMVSGFYLERKKYF